MINTLAMPAKAGIQHCGKRAPVVSLDPRFRGGDELEA